MDDPASNPRPLKRPRSASPLRAQTQHPRQDPGGLLTDTLVPGLSSIIDQGTSILLGSTTSDGAATKTHTRTRTRSSSQGGTSDGVSSTVDSGSSTAGAVSGSGGLTATGSSLSESPATDAQSSTADQNSMATHENSNHQQQTESAVPSSALPSSTSAFTSVLITTTATVNGHLTTFATLVPTTLSDFPRDSDAALKPPAVAATVVGTLLATALLAGLGWLFNRRRKQRKAQSALNAARKQSMRRGRRVLDDDDNDGEEDDSVPMRYGSAGSHAHSMSTSYQYGVVGSLPAPSGGGTLPSSSSFGFNLSQDTLSFSQTNNEFAGRDPAEVRRMRAGRTGSSSGSIFREDFAVIGTSTPRPDSSLASSPTSAATPTTTGGNPFEGGSGAGYFPPHKRTSTASSSALGLLEAIGGVAPSASLEVVNASRSGSPVSEVGVDTQLPYHQPQPQKRSSLASTRSLSSPKSSIPLSGTSAGSSFQYPPPPQKRSPPPPPAQRQASSPRSSIQSPYMMSPNSNTKRNSLSSPSSSLPLASPPTSLPPGAASPLGPLARTSIIVDEQFGVSAGNPGLPHSDYYYKPSVTTPPASSMGRRRSSSSGSQQRGPPPPAFDPADLMRERKRRDSFVLPDLGVSGTGSMRDRERGSSVDLKPYLSSEDDDGGKGKRRSGGRRPS